MANIILPISQSTTVVSKRDSHLGVFYCTRLSSLIMWERERREERGERSREEGERRERGERGKKAPLSARSSPELLRHHQVHTARRAPPSTTSSAALRGRRRRLMIQSFSAGGAALPRVEQNPALERERENFRNVSGFCSARNQCVCESDAEKLSLLLFFSKRMHRCLQRDNQVIISEDLDSFEGVNYNLKSAIWLPYMQKCPDICDMQL